MGIAMSRNTKGPEKPALRLCGKRHVSSARPFPWVGRDRCSIGEVRRRLEAAKEQTRTGKTVWDRTTIGGMLHNPAYKGEAACAQNSD